MPSVSVDKWIKSVFTRIFLATHEHHCISWYQLHYFTFRDDGKLYINLLCSKRWASPGTSRGSKKLPLLTHTAHADYKKLQQNNLYTQLQVKTNHSTHTCTHTLEWGWSHLSWLEHHQHLLYSHQWTNVLHHYFCHLPHSRSQHQRKRHC